MSIGLRVLSMRWPTTSDQRSISKKASTATSRCRVKASNSGDAEMRELEDELKELNKAVFVSTGGNPSLGQMRGMIDATIKPTIIWDSIETKPDKPLPLALR